MYRWCWSEVCPAVRALHCPFLWLGVLAKRDWQRLLWPTGSWNTAPVWLICLGFGLNSQFPCFSPDLCPRLVSCAGPGLPSFVPNASVIPLSVKAHYFLPSSAHRSTGTSNLLASLGHPGRSVVLGHTLNTQTLMKTDEPKVLSKFLILCWVAVIAILGCKQPMGCGLDTLALGA